MANSPENVTDSSYWVAVQPPSAVKPHLFGPYTHTEAESHRTCLMVYKTPIKVSVVFQAADRDQAEAIVEQFLRDTRAE